MAEIGAAAAALTLTVLKLSELLYNKANFFLDVKDGIERLKRELSWMQSFLKDAEIKFENSNLVREWVSDVRDLACEAENVIDTFHLKLGPKTHTGSCSSCISFSTNVSTIRKLGSQLEKLIVKANDISSRRDRYGLIAGASTLHKPNEKLKELRASTPYANNEHMIGLAETVRLLQDKLTNGGQGRLVISILGMGGLGKTTLARKLYNGLRREYFHFFAWICVSQDYDTKDILLQLIRSIINPTKNDLEELTTKDSMEEYLRNKLGERSFLVVIDDVWEREAWESIHRAFPVNNANSRIIITTRIRHVAELNSAYVHELRYLNDDECWELFCSKTFQYDKGMVCPLSLEQCGKEMVAKCSGLPLAIVILGGLLSTKSHGINEWEELRDNLWKELKKDQVHIDAVLSLSFKDLPDHLKLCFLYVGMFPEDSKIPTSKLMLLWEAEGFVGYDEEACPIDITRSYFNELVGRSLLQTSNKNRINSTCRVHDLIRDLAIKKAKEMSFSAYYGGNKIFDLLKLPYHRRLAMCNMDPQTIRGGFSIPGDYTNSNLRTLRLQLQNSEGIQSQSPSHITVNEFLQSLHQRFRLLRVLDVTIKGTMPLLQVGKLIHLRYLGLELTVEPGNAEPFKMPETLGDLKALETLSISSGRMVDLPKSVVKLQNLKHLIGRFKCSGRLLKKLTGLQTLELADYENWCELDTASLVNLRHLSLSISFVHPTDGRSSRADICLPPRFLLNFEGLTQLQKLVLITQLPFEISEIFKCCPNITHIRSYDWDTFKNPDLHAFAVNLQDLDLIKLQVGQFGAIISSVERFPRLRALRFSIASKVEKLNIWFWFARKEGFLNFKR